MFEGSLVESQGFAVSTTKRWTAVGSAAVQFAIAGLLIAIPLLHPEALPSLADAPHLALPATRPPQPPPVRVQTAIASSETASAPYTPAPVASNRGAILQRPNPDPGPEPSFASIHMGPGMSTGLPAGLGPGNSGSGVAVVRAAPAAPARVSQGVLAGMLLTPIQPAYPPIARAAGVQGTVAMEAVISKAGRIESLHVVSGPPMLREAALDAVRAARYQPYRLNGEVTEVQTQITVNFRLGS